MRLKRFRYFLPVLTLALAHPFTAAACSQCPDRLALKRSGWQCFFDELVAYQAQQADPVLVILRADCAEQRKDLERRINAASYGYHVVPASGGMMRTAVLDPLKVPKAIVVWEGLDKKSTEAILDAYKSGKPSSMATDIDPKGPTVLPWSMLQVTTKNLLIERLKNDTQAVGDKSGGMGGNPNLVVLDFESETPFRVEPVVARDPRITPPVPKKPGSGAAPQPDLHVVWLTKAQLACIARLRTTIETAKDDPYEFLMSLCK